MNQPISRQEGASLIVALVLLLLLTLAAVSTSSHIDLQVKTTQAAQGRYEAYQVAISEIEAQINQAVTTENELNTELFTEAMVAVSQTHSLTSEQLIVNGNNVAQSAQVIYLGTGGLVSGSEIDTQVHRFELNSIATSNLGAESDQIQGLSVEFPSGED